MRPAEARTRSRAAHPQISARPAAAQPRMLRGRASACRLPAPQARRSRAAPRIAPRAAPGRQAGHLRQALGWRLQATPRPAQRAVRGMLHWGVRRLAPQTAWGVARRRAARTGAARRRTAPGLRRRRARRTAERLRAGRSLDPVLTLNLSPAQALAWPRCRPCARWSRAALAGPTPTLTTATAARTRGCWPSMASATILPPGPTLTARERAHATQGGGAAGLLKSGSTRDWECAWVLPNKIVTEWRWEPASVRERRMKVQSVVVAPTGPRQTRMASAAAVAVAVQTSLAASASMVWAGMQRPTEPLLAAAAMKAAPSVTCTRGVRRRCVHAAGHAPVPLPAAAAAARPAATAALPRAPRLWHRPLQSRTCTANSCCCAARWDAGQLH